MSIVTSYNILILCLFLHQTKSPVFHLKSVFWLLISVKRRLVLPFPILCTPLLCRLEQSKGQNIQKISRSFIPIIKDYDITDYVLGWPINMDSSRSPGCDRVQSFADQMLQDTDIFGISPNILLWDERLSTEAVKEMVDKSVNKMKESGELDALAAQVILQGVLDAL